MAEPADTTIDKATALPQSEVVRHLACAEAAIILIESLMLLLVKHGVCSCAQMVGAVEDAVATKRQMTAEGEHPQISAVASGLLTTVANSVAAGGGAEAT